jgi:Ni/Co efflux regulator RcnB
VRALFMVPLGMEMLPPRSQRQGEGEEEDEDEEEDSYGEDGVRHRLSDLHEHHSERERGSKSRRRRFMAAVKTWLQDKRYERSARRKMGGGVT